MAYSDTVQYSARKILDQNENRTHDLRETVPPLYQLSYPLCCEFDSHSGPEFF